MSDRDLETARQFQSAVEAAFRSGDFEPVLALLAPDVEGVTPQHSVEGVEALIEELRRARPPDTFYVEVENGEWKSLGRGRYSLDTRALFRSKKTGELSYSRGRSFELTVRDGTISRYEMRFAG